MKASQFMLKPRHSEENGEKTGDDSCFLVHRNLFFVPCVQTLWYDVIIIPIIQYDDLD
jgi:hypothetical protein